MDYWEVAKTVDKWDMVERSRSQGHALGVYSLSLAPSFVCLSACLPACLSLSLSFS